jgi:hypothetical protein
MEFPLLDCYSIQSHSMIDFSTKPYFKYFKYDKSMLISEVIKHLKWVSCLQDRHVITIINLPCCQVSVNKIQWLQILHSWRNLSCHKNKASITIKQANRAKLFNLLLGTQIPWLCFLLEMLNVNFLYIQSVDRS